MDFHDGPSRVCVGEGVEYLYIDGVDINEVRLPKDRESLEAIASLIPQLLEEFEL